MPLLPNNILKLIALFGILVISTTSMWGQSTGRRMKPEDIPPEFRPPHPPAKMPTRYFQIDAKRASENIYSDDALPRSREFKRIDSTYYVGWMFEGVYKYTHAADYLGFKSAIYPLERALDLIERDYKKALKVRTGNIMELYPVRQFAPDYSLIVYNLVNSYSNTDQPDKAFATLVRMKKWNFQLHNYIDPYSYMAWTVHRNRFYTHSKYAFLRNSIDENEALAQRYLDTCMLLINKNKPLNDQLQPGLSESEKQTVYHYRNMLYSYSFQIDSAEKYFMLMDAEGRLPHNNYATFKAVCGDFRTAEKQYQIASRSDAGDKRLQEWAYYTSILQIYKGLPKEAITLSRNMIKAAGTTPGYGWYNIALSRAMLYDGQVAQSIKYANRAADFKEVHIGTTLGQSHYEFSVQLLKLINKEREWEMQKFEHRNWWYNFKVLTSMSSLLSEKYMQQFLIINQFAQNPERDRVIYKLFSNESTVSWDEIWYLLQDFSTKFFLNKFNKELTINQRPAIKKYFQLMVARLKVKQKNYTEAKRLLQQILNTEKIDPEYEKLFLARIYEELARCNDLEKKESERDGWLVKLYNYYPQLLPYCGMAMPMKLNVLGNANTEVVDRLKDCNINWVSSGNVPNAFIVFENKGKLKTITYYVMGTSGNYIVPRLSFSYTKPDEAGVQLAYKLFNIGELPTEQNK